MSHTRTGYFFIIFYFPTVVNRLFAKAVHAGEESSTYTRQSSKFSLEFTRIFLKATEQGLKLKSAFDMQKEEFYFLKLRGSYSSISTASPREIFCSVSKTRRKSKDSAKEEGIPFSFAAQYLIENFIRMNPLEFHTIF